MSNDRIHDAAFVCRERGRTPARSIDAAIVTELSYGCNCRSPNGNTARVHHTIFPGTVGIRNDVIHAPVASEISLVAFSKGACAVLRLSRG
jgi:hypothetical protein